MAPWSKEPLPPDWPKRRLACFATYGRLCYQCGALATDVDHVKPRSQGGSHEPENLRPICQGCHRRKTSREALAQRKTRRRAPEQHPGEILWSQREADALDTSQRAGRTSTRPSDDRASPSE